MTRQIHRDLVQRCRDAGIVVAFAWAPEARRYQDAFGPDRVETVAEYTRFLSDDLKSRVFAAPDCLAEDDFADGYHLLPAGAVRYSRWLAETHLKPWLAHAPTKQSIGR
jgi:hypothetical protein